MAFTDHNSIEGFRKWRSKYDEDLSLTEKIRDRDPNNPLLQQLDQEIKILKSVRVLMGVEIKAYPGIHLLLIFQESVKPETVVELLEEIYEKPYKEICGSPSPMTILKLEEVMDRASSRFGDGFFVVAPHIESGGGMLEALKDLAQSRMIALRHPALRALSFNKDETRVRVKNLLSQPEYARDIPLAFIQSSDAHGSRGTVGQPRAEVHVPNGRATFASIKEAFVRESRVKCSLDFADEDYSRLTKGEPIARFESQPDHLSFREEDHDRIAKFVCAALNSRAGILEISANLGEKDFTDAYPDKVLKEVDEILENRLEPRIPILLNRALSFSSTRRRVLLKPLGRSRLYVVSGSVYVLDGNEPRAAHASEIETIAAERLNLRFGKRFEKTLKRVSDDSILLSKLPPGIPSFCDVVSG